MSSAPNAGAAVEGSEAAAVMETTPSTETQETVQETQETTPESAGETPEQAGTEATQEAQSGEEGYQGYDQLLPWEQLETYPDELFTAAARKFGIDPKLVPQVQSLLKGKIDADIHARNLEAQSYVDEESAEGEPAKGQVAASGQVPLTSEQLDAEYDTAMGVAAKLVTDAGAQKYLNVLTNVQQELQAAYEKNDPAAIATAGKKVLATQYGLFLMGLKEVLPEVLPLYMNQAAEAEQTRVSTYAEARARLAKDPKYSDVDQLYDKAVFRQIAAEMPELTSKQFRDPRTGKPYPMDSVENAMAQYRYAIHLHRGQSVGSPTESVRRAAAVGKATAEKERNQSALGSLNAGGRSTGKVGGGEKDFMDGLLSADLEHNPMSTLSRANAFKK